MARLMAEGLPRHEALHAVGSVLADLLFDALKTNDSHFGNNLQERYDGAVEQLTADQWRRKYES